MGGLSGQASDIDIHAKEILRLRAICNKILSDHTGQPMEKIEHDVDRDYIMTAEESKQYGIVDQVIVRHE
jgi:ATP-dependent Clp protease protease subunit